MGRWIQILNPCGHDVWIEILTFFGYAETHQMDFLTMIEEWGIRETEKVPMKEESIQIDIQPLWVLFFRRT